MTPDPNGWRPISEAPRDEERHLFVTRTGIMRVDRFHPEQFGRRERRWEEKGGDRYTHWMPLPPAPAAPPTGEDDV